MPVVCCIDTQILYWAIVKKAAPGAEPFLAKASDFMKWVEQQNYSIIVPTIVVGEMLIPVPEADHPNVLTQFGKDWMIVEYDLKAVAIFAKIRRDQITQHRIRDLRDLHPDVTKKELVADVMIIATALAHGADTIFSYNKDLRALADGFITAKSPDDVNFQTSLNLPSDGETE